VSATNHRVEIAVLSYHGWEISPEYLAADVIALRAAGWRDVSLDELPALLDRGGSHRYFHVTLDDGAAGDLACVDALRTVSCAATLFVPLEAMTPKDRVACESLRSASDVAIEDHSLLHRRTFHYRHVIGFHCSERPFLTSPERLGLRIGDPVCTFGGELVRPRFIPDEGATRICREHAATLSAASRGGDEWHAALAAALIANGLASWRLARLCLAGIYEEEDEFNGRIADYLRTGFERLRAFTGRAPKAFAHPWWQPSPVADRVLRELGYALTFSGRGLCRERRRLAIPRLPVTNRTPRPLDPIAVARRESDPAPIGEHLRSLGRRLVFA
jgi:hypothetical protein